MKTLSNLELLALSKTENILGKDKCVEVRAAVEKGTYAIDFWLRVHGSMTVAKDSKAKIPLDFHEWPLLLATLGKLSDQERAVLIRKVVASPAPNEGQLEALKAEIGELVEAIKGRQERATKGAVKAVLMFDPVDTSSLNPAPVVGSPFGS